MNLVLEESAPVDYTMLHSLRQNLQLRWKPKQFFYVCKLKKKNGEN